ncbi:MAG: ATP-dependent RecD-like DNA helicase [Ruminococcaceae bacterium]|nr:ATP-dependent RecD-like DNA helicase [Oscillospiraceae bacterium]
MSQNTTQECIIGTIENVVFRNEKNDYTVIDVADEQDNLILAVGIMPLAFEGERVKLYGKWTYHKEFGRQFAFESFEKTLPEEEEGILQYLSSRTVKGIGPVTALKIVNRYGKDSFDVIENHPEWLADIPGITLKKAAAISASFREQAGIRGVIMFCKDFMGTSEVTRVYKQFGSGAVGIIKQNPYILCDGEVALPFEKVDALAKSLGVDLESKNRILSGIRYTLAQAASQGGHTCLPEEDLIARCAELLEIERTTVSSTMNELLDEDELAIYKKNDVNLIMTSETAESEDYIVKHIVRLSEEAECFDTEDIAALIERVELGLDISFARMQREALFASLENGIMILTGGPGTGKTTVVKALISIFKEIGFKTVLAAPTGRAAKRMSEATSEEAKTVHRMLEMERSTDGQIKFCKNEKNPISEKVIIVDEASMLDLSLTSALLRAMRRGARLILIGDSDQLPSVGAGNILSDLISSERIKTVRLTEIFRQSNQSLIITNAHRINEGEIPLLSVIDNDFFFVRRESENQIAATIASLIDERLPKTYGADIREKIQVITPSRKGAGGVEALNAALQEKLNPAAKFKKEKLSHGKIFREGDRVMQVANNYDIEWEKNGAVGVGLFNGDIGTIQEIDLREENMTIRFDDREAVYSFDMLEELELAYAITVHKSQGSEYPVVIIPMYACPPMLMTRNLFYTAVTRARNMVILVGRSDIPRKMVENNREVMRYTTLRDKICDYI